MNLNSKKSSGTDSANPAKTSETLDSFLDKAFLANHIQAGADFLDNTILKIYEDAEKDEALDTFIEENLAKNPCHADKNFANKVFSKIRLGGSVNFKEIFAKIGYIGAAATIIASVYISQAKIPQKMNSADYFVVLQELEDSMSNISSMIAVEEFLYF